MSDTVPAIDLIIPTLNEADNISEVVANAALVGKVFVVDSGNSRVVKYTVAAH